MSDREKLEEIIARAICRHRTARACDWRGHDSCADGCQARITSLLADFHEVGHQAKAVIAAAEREGFRFLGPDDGR